MGNWLKSGFIAFLLATLLLGCNGNGTGYGLRGTAATRVGHVFIIVLENKDFEDSFGPDSPAPFLATTLPAQGALLQNYYGTSHVSLGNYISMISGQGPNITTQSDCLVFLDFIALLPSLVDGQVLGQGCVYPTFVPNLTDQLKTAGLGWKAYMEDMGNTPSRESATCGHPALNSQDGTQAASAEDQYATRHNPFMYFHSIIDDQDYCDAHVVNLERLPADLAIAARTPNYVFITPNLCNDGHDSPCANGDPGGLISANEFLQTWVPRIMRSPAFRQDGMLIVTFDESEGPQSDASACCGEGPTTNTPLPGITGLGGGKVGAVVLSPFVKPGTVSATPYNHYSMLRTVEDLFGLQYLGFAGASAQQSFGSDVFSARMPELPPKN